MKQDHEKTPGGPTSNDLQALTQALQDAAQSLETISQQAGRSEFMQELGEVRGYAGSRASIARVALIKAGGRG